MSNKSCGGWGAIFGDPVIATAILDRLPHHLTTINIRGESYWLKDRRKAALLRGREQRRPTAELSAAPASAAPKPRRPRAALGSAPSGATGSGR